MEACNCEFGEECGVCWTPDTIEWKPFPGYVEPLDSERKKREAYEMVLKAEMQVFEVRLRRALGIAEDVRVVQTVSLVKGQPYGSVTLDDNYFVGYTV